MLDQIWLLLGEGIWFHWFLYCDSSFQFEYALMCVSSSPSNIVTGMTASIENQMDTIIVLFLVGIEILLEIYVYFEMWV